MKRRKSTRNCSSRRKNTTLLVDRISELPDSILGLILSNLPTKDAVATSILSKRWKSVWMTVHSLDFCLDNWYRGFYGDENIKFAQFVNRVLLLLDGGLLNKFRLVWWSSDYIPSEFKTWINTAITRTVNDLSIFLLSFGEFDDDNCEECDDYGAFKVPASVLSSDTLRCLELKGTISVSAASVFCLPRLESLKLVSIYFQSEESFEKLISECPILNNLHLDMNMNQMCWYIENDGDFTYIISSTSLRRLELSVELSDDFLPPSLHLKASSLEHLKLDGFIAEVCVQGTLSSLEADFKIRFCEDELSEDTCNSVVEALVLLVVQKFLLYERMLCWYATTLCFRILLDFTFLLDMLLHVHSCLTSLIDKLRPLAKPLLVY